MGAGGAAFATCAVVDGRRRVQQSQMLRLMHVIMPVAVLTLAFLSWEMFSMFYLHTCCVCIPFEFFGVLGLFFFWALVAWLSLCFWDRSHVESFWSVVFVVCICGSSCLVAVNLLFAAESEWLLANNHATEQVIFISLQNRCRVGSICLFATGSLCPWWCLW